MKNKAIYTTKEAACYLGVSPSTIYRMEKRGVLSPARTSGRQRHFSQKSIEECLRKSQSFETLQIREKPTLYEVTVRAEPYFQEDSICIHNTDFLRTDCIKEGTIDLVITSPPYNVGIKYNSHDDTMFYKDYLSFTREWLAKCYRLSKNDGRLCLNIPLDKNKGGNKVYVPTSQQLQNRWDGGIILRLYGMSKTFQDGLHGVHGFLLLLLMLSLQLRLLLFFTKSTGRRLVVVENQTLPKKNLWIGQTAFGLLWVRVKKELAILHHSLWNCRDDV